MTEAWDTEKEVMLRLVACSLLVQIPLHSLICFIKLTETKASIVVPVVAVVVVVAFVVEVACSWSLHVFYASWFLYLSTPIKSLSYYFSCPYFSTILISQIWRYIHIFCSQTLYFALHIVVLEFLIERVRAAAIGFKADSPGDAPLSCSVSRQG